MQNKKKEEDFLKFTNKIITTLRATKLRHFDPIFTLRELALFHFIKSVNQLRTRYVLV